MQLKPDKFSMVQHLLNGDNSHWPLLKSVLQQDLGGQIFVDNIHEIRSALVISRLGWVYFLGSENCDGFNQEVLKILQQKKDGNIIWFGASDGWRKLVEMHISEVIQDFPRFQFHFNAELFESSNCAAPVEVFSVNDLSLDSILHKYYRDGSFWDDRSNFLRKGFGFYIRDKGEIVSAIMSASVADSDVEIDIHTDENHRRKGYAETLSRAFIKTCINRELSPKWDCYFKNIPSISLAAKLGFINPKQYQLIFISP